MFRVPSPALNNYSKNSIDNYKLTQSSSFPDIKIHESAQAAEKIGKLTQTAAQKNATEHTYTLSQRAEEHSRHLSFNEASSSRPTSEELYPTAFSAQFHQIERAKRAPFERSSKIQQLEEQYNHLDDRYQHVVQQANHISLEKETLKKQADQVVYLSNLLLLAYQQKSAAVDIANKDIVSMIANNKDIAKLVLMRTTALRNERSEKIRLAKAGKTQRAEIEDLKRQLAEARQETDSLRKDAAEKSKINMQLTLENNQQSERLHETQAGVQTLTTTNKELVSSLEHENGEKEILSQKIEALQTSLSKAHGLLGQAKNEISSLKGENASLSLKLADAERKKHSTVLNFGKEKYAELGKKIQDLSLELTEQQKKTTTVEHKYSERGLANEALSQTNTSLKANLKNSNTNITKLKDRVSKLQKELDKAKEDSTTQNEKYNNFEKEYNNLKIEYEIHNREVLREKMNLFLIGATVGAFVGYKLPKFT